MKAALSAVALCALICPAPADAVAADPSRGDVTRDGEARLLVPMRSGAFVTFSTEVEPPASHEAPASFVESEGAPNLVRRLFLDGRGELFFGYELLVELAPAPLAGPRQFRVAVRPLGEEFLRLLAARPSFKRRLHPGYNPAAFDTRPQLVGDGDTFALDVLRNPRTGAKIIDLVTVTSEDPRRHGLPASTRPPRDFNAEEVQLKVSDYTLLVDGEVVQRSRGGCAGRLVWFSLPGRGRFILSLVSRSGYDFRQAGTVEHNRLAFEWEGERYEWISSAPVVDTGGNWKLWVLHDPEFHFDLSGPATRADGGLTFEQKVRRATDPRDRAEFEAPGAQGAPARKRRVRVVIGAADSVEWLNPQRQ